MNNVTRYSASFPVQSQFITNADGTGDQIFTQIKRNGPVCLYRRERAKGGLFGFEVVVVKTIKAGTPLPGNNVVQADYEQYPGSSAFGRSAWFCQNESAADQKFNSLLKLQSTEVEVDSITTDVVTEVVDVVTVPVVQVKKAEKKTDAVWNIPQGEFTQADFARANGLPERGTVYNILQSVIAAGTVKLSKREQIGGRGRATCFYIASV